MSPSEYESKQYNTFTWLSSDTLAVINTLPDSSPGISVPLDEMLMFLVYIAEFFDEAFEELPAAFSLFRKLADGSALVREAVSAA